MASHPRHSEVGRKSGRRRVPSRMDPEGWTLSTEQAMFIAYYFGESKHDANDACRRLGYADPARKSYRMMRNPAVKAAIAAQLNQHCMSVQEAFIRQTEVARANMDDFFTLVNGRLRFDYAKAQKLGKTHLIKKIKFTIHGVEVELHDSQAAQQRILDYHGAFNHTHKIEHSLDIPWEKLPPDLLERFVARQITKEQFLQMAHQIVINGEGLIHEAEGLPPPDPETSSP